tara:strand:- start:73 stop:381 length:309 start_codon:yes stop_codon:yes gene_type:complete
MDDLFVSLLLTFIGMIVASLCVTLYFWLSIRHFFYKEEDCYIPNLIVNNPFESGNLPNNKFIKIVMPFILFPTAVMFWILTVTIPLKFYFDLNPWIYFFGSS